VLDLFDMGLRQRALLRQHLDAQLDERRQCVDARHRGTGGPELCFGDRYALRTNGRLLLDSEWTFDRELKPQDISVSPRRITEIIHGNRALSADTLLRLDRYGAPAG
jgi:hypothetical protein